MKELKTIPTLGFVDALNAATSKVFQFEGRSRRSEYWWMQLTVLLVTIIVPQIGAVLSLLLIPLTFRRLHDTGRSGWWWGAYALAQVGVVVLFVCDMMVVMPHLNEGNFNMFELVFGFFAKWLIYIIFVLVFKAVLLVFMCIDSEACPNKYGDSPKYVEVEAGSDI